MALSATDGSDRSPRLGSTGMKPATAQARGANSATKPFFPTPSATPSPISSRSVSPQPPESANFAVAHPDKIPTTMAGLTQQQQQLHLLAQQQSAMNSESYSRPSSSLSQYMAKRKADYSPDNVQFDRVRISKFTVEPQEDYYIMEVDESSILRRCRDNFINGTKLLNLTKVTKGQRDSLLRKSVQRDVETAGPRWLRGIWVPLEYAQALIDGLELNHYFFPLLEVDPSQYFDKNIVVKEDKSFILEPMSTEEIDSQSKAHQQLAVSLQRSQKRHDESSNGGSSRKRPKSFGGGGGSSNPTDVNPAAVNSIDSTAALVAQSAYPGADTARPLKQQAIGSLANKRHSLPAQQQRLQQQQNQFNSSAMAHPHTHHSYSQQQQQHQQQQLQHQQNRSKPGGCSTPISALCASTRTSFHKQVVEDPILPNIFTSICPCSPQLIATPVDENAPPLQTQSFVPHEGFWDDYGLGGCSEEFRAVDVLMLSQGQVADSPIAAADAGGGASVVCCDDRSSVV